LRLRVTWGLEIGEIAGKLDSLLEVEGSPPCDHAEILARLGEIEGKLDAFIAAATAPEPEPIVEPEPEEDTVVITEPEPQPEEHPFFKPVFGES
jgi:hypothetical protein